MIPLGVLAQRQAAPGGGALALTYQTATSDVTNATVYTFAANEIGAADASRVVVVALHARRASPSATVSAVTIGGVTATVAHEQTNTGNTSTIAYAPVPSGTTADVVVTYSTEVLRAGLGVWTLTGGTVAVSEAADLGGTVTGVTGGAIIASASGTGNVVMAWSDSTRRYNLQLESWTHSGADSSAVGAIVPNRTSSGTSPVGSVVVFAPA